MSKRLSSPSENSNGRKKKKIKKNGHQISKRDYAKSEKKIFKSVSPSNCTFSSDEDGDDEIRKNIIPLESLEDTSNVTSFTDTSSSFSPNGKQPKEKKTIHGQEEKKILVKKKVWRKFERENQCFKKYYIELFKWTNKTWKDFTHALSNPPSVYFMLNASRPCLMEDVEASLRCDFNINGIELRSSEGILRNVEYGPLDWIENIYKINVDRKTLRKDPKLSSFSRYLSHQVSRGIVLRQDLSSLVMVHFLDIQPGQMVLDMLACALRVPQIIQSFFISNEDLEGSTKVNGGLVLNRPKLLSSDSFSGTVSRTVAFKSVVAITSHQPEEFPLYKESDGFDRIICTPLSSGDGWIRQDPEAWRNWMPTVAYSYHAKQIAQLERSIQLLKVDGLLLYSTHSINPIENEAVLAQVLRSYPGSLELCSLSHHFQELTRYNGLSTWKVYDNEMNELPSWEESSKEQRKNLRGSMWPPTSHERDTMNLCHSFRILPHDHDTHGIFIAVIRKKKALQYNQFGPVLPTIDSAVKNTGAKNQVNENTLGAFSSLPSKEFRELKRFFGLKQLYTSNLVSRNDLSLGGDAVYLISSKLAEFLSMEPMDDVRLNILQIGSCVFRKYKKNERSECKYQLFMEGISEMEKFMQRRRLILNLDIFEEFLKKKQIWINQLPKHMQICTKNVEEEGPLALVLDTADPVQTAGIDILLSAWKGHSSIFVLNSTKELKWIQDMINQRDINRGNDIGDYDSMDYDDD